MAVLAVLAGMGVFGTGVVSARGKKKEASPMNVSKNSRYNPSDNAGDQSYYKVRLDRGDYDSPLGQKLLAGQAPTQMATQTAGWDTRHHFVRHPQRTAVPTISVNPNLNLVELRMSDEARENQRRHIQNTEWPEVPFRGVRAEFYPDRERRRMPFINNPDSIFMASAITVPPISAEHEPYQQLPKMGVESSMDARQIFSHD